MPVIRVPKYRLEQVIGRTLSLEELEELLFRLKCEVESASEDILEIELNSDRPDMLITEGLGRALKGILGIEKGMPSYTIQQTSITVRVDPPPTRPYIAVGVVYNVRVDYDFIEELIQFQEKLHITYGRNRKKIAIGFHDLSKLPSNQIYYKEVDVDKVRFIPLHGSEPMTARKVLEKLKQGQEYGRISLREDKYHPMLFSGNHVIAMPPVINADITRVEPGTKDLFIDVTGTNREAVEKVLDIIVTGLAERGGVIGKVRVHYPEHETWTPILRVDKKELGANYVNKVLGLKLNLKEIIEHLQRMRFNAKPLNDNRVLVEIPPFRVDILHSIDLVEDIAMSIGYDNLEPEPPQPSLPTMVGDKHRFLNRLREILVGLGFQELHLYMLTSSKSLEKLGYREFVKLANPVTEELDALRPTLINQILNALKMNQHVEMPVKIFAIGDIVLVDYSKETRTSEQTVLSAAYMSGKASFEDLQAPLYAALRTLGLNVMAKKIEHQLFINGRAARIIIDGEERGVLGEIKPEILELFQIKYPIILCEVNLTRIWNRRRK